MVTRLWSAAAPPAARKNKMRLDAFIERCRRPFLSSPCCNASKMMLPPSPSSSTLALAAAASIFTALFVRRRMRVRAALSAWSRVAAAHGLSNAPDHRVRVVVTGFFSCGCCTRVPLCHPHRAIDPWNKLRHRSIQRHRPSMREAIV